MHPNLKWEAVYKDGSVHTEEELGSSEKVDRSQLREFRLYGQEKTVIFRAFFDNPDRKLIFRRRVLLDMGGRVKDIVYLVGWHQNIEGVSVKSICYIYGDGHVEFDDSRNDLELVPCEL
jgi:hypothetical protein